MCKKAKLDEARVSANRHFSSADWHLRSANQQLRNVDWHSHSVDWHKIKTEPRYVWFKLGPIRFNFLGIKPNPICVYRLPKQPKLIF